MNYLIILIDIAAGLVIGIIAVRALFGFLISQKKSNAGQSSDQAVIRAFLVSGLIIGIDLEVGADVLRTILIPSLDDLLSLVIVVGLRVVLNWSLESK